MQYLRSNILSKILSDNNPFTFGFVILRTVTVTNSKLNFSNTSKNLNTRICKLVGKMQPLHKTLANVLGGHFQTCKKFFLTSYNFLQTFNAKA